jgi:hypothetical protein
MNRLPVRAGAGFCNNIFHHFDRCIQLSSIFFGLEYILVTCPTIIARFVHLLHLFKTNLTKKDWIKR